MGDSRDETAASIDKLQKSLDLLHGVVAGVYTAQQQMRTQLEHQAAAIASSSTKHDNTARILTALLDKMQRLEVHADKRIFTGEEPDPGGGFGRGGVSGGESGGTGGSASGGAGGSGADGAGGSGSGGAGGGGSGGADGGRTHSFHHESSDRVQMQKMPFPKFDGEHPRIWRNKCHAYFRAFNISPTLCITTAT